jgi:translation initiation factor IF-2
MMPPPGEAPRPPRNAPPKGRGGRQQYPKKQEGPMKGFAPPPRFGGAQIPQEPLPITRTITVTEGTSVKDLAEKLEIRGKDLIATLLMRGIFVTVNQSLDGELVKDVARQFGADANVISYEDEISNQSLEEILESDNIDELEVSRSPVVTVMGHVDHGKTSLLDAIRETEVAAGEAGGITQHIGAYKVKFTKEGSPANGREIVFLDTPGHEAFTRMRARGAKVTDLVVIVVAADDGVMPQTLEAVDHAKAAGVPIIVAINKIDKPDADPGRVKKQLADRGLIPDDWGGDVVYVEVSAKKRINLDLLLEMICLQSDLKNLKATPGRKAVGTVIEAKLDRGRGVVASVLVQNGTLHSGESFIMGNTFGKIRAMFDDRGRAVVEAGPSTPVEILGLEAMPDAGDTFLVVADRDKAKGIADFRRMKDREAQLAKSSRVSLEGLAEQIRTAGVKDLPLIIKGDVTGSVEVLADSLVKMSTEKVRIKVIRSGVGAITESDILLASASNAIVIGFNVRPERKAAELADQEKVEIRLHSIIYELQDEIRRAMFGLLDPTFKENYLGKAEILNIFKIPKVGTILGCSVKDGVIRRDAEVRILRKDEEVGKGKIGSLKRFKDDAKEVTNGMECGIGINGFSEFQVGDVIEAFTTEKIASDLGALSSEVTARAEAAAKAEAAASAEAEAAKP